MVILELLVLLRASTRTHFKWYFHPPSILHFPFFWLFGGFLSLWSCITRSRLNFLHVATFHPHFSQAIAVVALWSFCNSWCFWWVSSPCHLAHGFVVILHNNNFVVLKITIVNDNEGFNIFIFFYKLSLSITIGMLNCNELSSLFTVGWFMWC